MTMTSSETMLNQLTQHQTGFVSKRPFITLSFAQSLDGCISANVGQRLHISCHESLKLTHQLRAIHGGLLVGISTVLVDNPRLNVRLANGTDPRTIVLDSTLRFPPNARMLNTGASKPIIATGQHLNPEKAQNLKNLGLKIVPFKLSDESLVPIPDLLQNLYHEGIRSIMVEGGSKVITSFLKLGICDFMVVTVSPMIIGNSKSVRYGLSESEKVPYLKNLRPLNIGSDLVLWGSPTWKELRPIISRGDEELQ